MSYDDEPELKDIAKRERLAEIREAHDRVGRYDEELYQLYLTDQISREKVSKHLGRAVKMFIIEVEPLLNPPDGEPAEHWTDAAIGEIPLPTGADEVLPVVGLGAYVDLPDEPEVTVEERVQERYYQMGEKKEVEKAVNVPIEIHRRAYRVTNLALDDLGLGLSTTEGEEAEWTTDYRDREENGVTAIRED